MLLQCGAAERFICCVGFTVFYLKFNLPNGNQNSMFILFYQIQSLQTYFAWFSQIGEEHFEHTFLVFLSIFLGHLLHRFFEPVSTPDVAKIGLGKNASILIRVSLCSKWNCSEHALLWMSGIIKFSLKSIRNWRRFLGPVKTPGSRFIKQTLAL